MRKDMWVVRNGRFQIKSHKVFLIPFPPTLTPFTSWHCYKQYSWQVTNISILYAWVSTRFAFAFPLVSDDASREMFTQADPCLVFFSILQSDSGTTFTANVIHHLHTALGSCQILISSFSPNVNGLVEAFNKTLINIILHDVVENSI